MNKPTLTEQEKHAAAIQLYDAFNELREAADKIPVSYVLSKSMLLDLKAIVEAGLLECEQKLAG